MLHEGVKFGSENAANYLFATFDDGDPMVGNIKDPTHTGYWLPYLLEPRLPRQHEWDAQQTPMFYKRGEFLEPHRQGLFRGDGRVMWRFLGVLEQVPARQPTALVRAGILREVVRAATVPACGAGKNCPQTGVWLPVANQGHPQAVHVNPWWRQAFIEAGQPMPDARTWGLDAVPERITWYLVEAGAWTTDPT